MLHLSKTSISQRKTSRKRWIQHINVQLNIYFLSIEQILVHTFARNSPYGKSWSEACQWLVRGCKSSQYLSSPQAQNGTSESQALDWYLIDENLLTYLGKNATEVHMDRQMGED